MQNLRAYYVLTKPGIVLSNVMMAMAGFFFASGLNVDLRLFIGITAGITLVIASACVLNNYIDQSVDRKMRRTQKRPLITGEVSTSAALIYMVVLGVSGFALLGYLTNVLTLLLGVLAYVFYVAIYGWVKRRSEFGTLVGTIPGALPPVAGYTAATGQFDGAAVVLFFILVCWQMPHFFAIAIFRLGDYKAAGIPVLPIVKGMAATKHQMIAFVALLTLVVPLLTVVGEAGIAYVVVATALCLYWLRVALDGVKTDDDIRWAKRMFGASFVVLLGLAPAIALGSLLP